MEREKSKHRIFFCRFEVFHPSMLLLNFVCLEKRKIESVSEDNILPPDRKRRRRRSSRLSEEFEFEAVTRTSQNLFFSIMKKPVQTTYLSSISSSTR